MLWPHRTRRAVLAVVISTLAIAGATPMAMAATTGGSKQAWAGKVITLGAVFSTTGTGVAYGPQQVKGARLAVSQINAAGGIKGAVVHLVIDNDDSQPAQSALVMQSLITSHNVLAVLGPTFSNSAAAADPVANSLATPVLAVSNTGPGIVGSCAYPCSWIYRDSIGDATTIPANIGYYVKRAHPHAAVVMYPSADPFGMSTGQIASQAFTSGGVDQVSSVTVADPTALSGPVQTALAAHPNVVAITGSSAAVAGALIKELRAQGFTGQILGGNAFNSPTAATAAGSAGIGARSGAAWYVGNSSAVNRAFVSDYKRRYGTNPDQFAALAYTGVQLLARAARSAPLKFSSTAADRSALGGALARVRMNTPLGSFQFTPAHDVEQPIWLLAMNGKGGYRLVQQLHFSPLDQRCHARSMTSAATPGP
ncbi:MAG TPA: ABC transporter substrate-binding protein [Acidimicrobiales bacterium]|jgi:branched-chain amino acid transport system substrate-binding protein|nr:ABC transporter substrate-binding protein [Acidimicrobiales bacterium]